VNNSGSSTPIFPAPPPPEDGSGDPRVEKAKDILRVLGNRLLAGILVSVPLIVTLMVLRVAYQAIHAVTAPFLSALGINFPGSAFFATLLLLLGIGFMATHVLGKKIIESFERLILRIPVIAPLYNAVKQALESFRSFRDHRKFRGVAYVPYPHPGYHLIGFVTGNMHDPKIGGDVTTVFVPTSPNPLTGFVLTVPDRDLIESKLSLEQASKIIVSAGLVTPGTVPASGQNEPNTPADPTPANPGSSPPTKSPSPQEPSCQPPREGL
jgi:uncharacterized membrane protein